MVEIERKYLVTQPGWREHVTASTPITQGYISAGEDGAVRVRLRGDEEVAILTIKGSTTGVVRAEFEYEIPREDGQKMLEQVCPLGTVEKVRHRVEIGQEVWVVDVFEGDNEGLILAEIELEDPEQDFTEPDWIGQEVSEDARYFNACLAQQPYRQWSDEGPS